MFLLCWWLRLAQVKSSRWWTQHDPRPAGVCAGSTGMSAKQDQVPLQSVVSLARCRGQRPVTPLAVWPGGCGLCQPMDTMPFQGWCNSVHITVPPTPHSRYTQSGPVCGLIWQSVSIMTQCNLAVVGIHPGHCLYQHTVFSQSTLGLSSTTEVSWDGVRRRPRHVARSQPCSQPSWLK